MNARPSRRTPRLQVRAAVLLVLIAAAVVAAAAVGTAAAARAAAPLAAVTPSQATVAGGGLDSLLIKPDGTLWSWGANYYGELGLGDTVPRAVPTQVGVDTDWKQIAAGPNGTVKYAIKQDGTLWSWGDNEAYFLMGSGGPPVLAPAQVGSDTDWATVAVGAHFALAIKANGTLWARGDNSYGQLGLGDTADRPALTQVGSDTDWKTVACGRDHAVALKTDDTLWVWGSNLTGQLGTGDTTDLHVPTPLADPAGVTGWKAIGCGSLHTLAITTDGALYAWGNNFRGELGQGDFGPGTERPSPVRVGTDTDWVAVDGGEWHSVGLKSDGTLWGWGENTAGALGPSLGNIDLGYNVVLTPGQIDTATDWAGVSCGDMYTLAEKADGSFLAWGDNLFGQIGIGYPLARPMPERLGSVGGWTAVAAGASWGVGVRDDGTLWGWGLAPGLNLDGYARAPVQIGAARDWRTVFAGRGYVTAIRTDGTLWAWGSNDHGQLGLGDTDYRSAPEQVGSSTAWTSVACGSAVIEEGDHTLALRSDGSLWAWGGNSKGELGLGDTTERHAPARVGSGTDWASIAAAGHCSFAITASGELYSWGKNASGELGLDNTGIEPNVPTRVGTDSDWLQVAAADDAGQIGPDQVSTNFVLGVKTGGTLWSWGDRDSMGLGQPNGAVFDNLSPAQVGSDTDWAMVAAGDEISAAHGLAIKTDGTMWSWGKNSGGGLGVGDYRWRFAPVQVGADQDWSTIACSENSYALKSDGTLWTWGWNNVGQLGLGDPTWFPVPVDLVLTTDADTTDPTVSASPAPSASSAAAPQASANVASAASLRAAAPGWYRKPVTVSFTASDGGWGVARTQYTINGGISWLTASKVTFKTSGKRTVIYNAVDRANNAAVPQTVVIHVDLLKPVTAALNGASAARGGRATLRYKVTDKWSPACTVKIVIKKTTGRVVKTVPLGARATGKSLTTRVRCALPAGHYRWCVYATDLAGNTQKSVASNALVVR